MVTPPPFYASSPFFFLPVVPFFYASLCLFVCASLSLLHLQQPISLLDPAGRKVSVCETEHFQPTANFGTIGTSPIMCVNVGHRPCCINDLLTIGTMDGEVQFYDANTLEYLMSTKVAL